MLMLIGKVTTKVIKLKKLIKESKFAFDRKFGEPLPTFTSVMKKHQTNESDERVSEVTKSTCPECGHEYQLIKRL